MTYPAPEGLTIGADWRGRTSRGTWLFYVFGNRRLRPLRATRVQRDPEWIVRDAFPDPAFDRWGLMTLYDRVGGGDAAYRTTAWLRLWLAHAIERRQVEVWFVPERIGRASAPTVAEMMPFYEGLAQQRGVRATAKGEMPPVANIQDSRHFTTYLGPGSTVAMKDEFDADTCPTFNYRSESIKTARPEVIAWLERHMQPRFNEDGLDRWSTNLGDHGGGGFLRGTTRVSTLPKGTLVYRYYAPTTGAQWTPYALGGWWSPTPIAGDPRVESALPPENGAYKMCVGEIREDCEILVGLGAPRCSNKPGGPVQYLIPPSKPIDDTYAVNRWICLQKNAQA